MLFDATVIPREPNRVMSGVVHLPAFFTSDERRDIIEQASELVRSVAGTPVAMRQPRVGKGKMDAWMLSFGWFWANSLTTDLFPTTPWGANGDSVKLFLSRRD